MKTRTRLLKTTGIGKIALLAISPCFFLPSASHAEGYLVPGTTHYGSSTYDEWDSPDAVVIPAAVDNSYYCRAPGFSGVDLTDFSNQIVGPSSTTPAVVFRGNADGLGNQEAAFSFIAQATGSHVMNIDGNSTGSGTSFSSRALVECFNTTLFGNYNTVTVANPVNFLELKNISTAALGALIIVKTAAGTEVARFTRSIAAGERQDIGIHDLGANVVNTFGTIQIAHDGALGALVGNVSKYQVSGSALNITATEPLRERVQK